MHADAFFLRELRAFLDASPTPFHACANLRAALLAAGFLPLEERDRWVLQPGGRYCVTRNESSLVAFTLGRGAVVDTGLRLVGAHTDSPCLKIKPQPEITAQGYWQLGVEVYGGALLNPWFDRDLSLAGRVALGTAEGALCSRLVDLRAPVACIPSLAIHLDREANEKRRINRQTHLPPLIGRAFEKDFDLRRELLLHLAQREPALAGASVLDFELSLYDLQPSALVGWHGEYLASARLDNLLSCFAGMAALREAAPDQTQLLVCNDHEEVGSLSAAGARGTFLRGVIERIVGVGEPCSRAMARSLFVSTDNAHGVHPNFADRHDGRHGPILNGGPAIKVNANQSYASNSETAALFRHACARASVPTQTYVVRSDLPCGSTIGPATATALGVRTVDVGVPTFAMHSIRELAGRDDPELLSRALKIFFELSEV